VDDYKYRIYAALLCEGFCANFSLLFYLIGFGHLWFSGMEKKGK
jgi:hypothetical protein